MPRPHVRPSWHPRHGPNLRTQGLRRLLGARHLLPLPPKSDPSTPLAVLFLQSWLPELLLPGESSPCASDSFVLNSYGTSTPESLMWKSLEAGGVEGGTFLLGGQGCVWQHLQGVRRQGGLLPGQARPAAAQHSLSLGPGRRPPTAPAPAALTPPDLPHISS